MLPVITKDTVLSSAATIRSLVREKSDIQATIDFYNEIGKNNPLLYNLIIACADSMEDKFGTEAASLCSSNILGIYMALKRQADADDLNAESFYP